MIMTRAIAFSLGGMAAGLAVMLAAMPAAWAQDVGLQSLIDRLDRIERDLGGVQRYIYRDGEAGTAPPPAGGGAALSPQQELRLSQLEDELRALTGRVEEAQFLVRQMDTKMTSFLADMEARMAALESRAAARPSTVSVVTPPRAQSGAPPAETLGTADPGGRIVRVDPDPNSEVYDTMDSLGVVTAGDHADATGGTDEIVDDPTSIAAATPIDEPVSATPQVDPTEVYDVAYQLLRQADYSQAEVALQDFIDTYPDHPLSGNAYYWLGETHYVRNDYERAAVAFARGYKSFPTGSKASANLLKLGMSLFGMNESAKACATYARLRTDFPDAPASIAERATQEARKAGC